MPTNSHGFDVGGSEGEMMEKSMIATMMMMMMTMTSTVELHFIGNIQKN